MTYSNTDWKKKKAGTVPQCKPCLPYRVLGLSNSMPIKEFSEKIHILNYLH